MKVHRGVVSRGIPLLFAALMLAGLTRPAAAFPQFARKYHLACATCHSMVPRLTRFGYAFLRAGFRLPSNVQKPITLDNSLAYTIATLMAQSRTAPNVEVPGVDTALATSLGKQWAVHIRYTTGFSGGSQSGFSDFWGQYNTSPRGVDWSVKVGQIPVIDGYQLAGDRTLTITDAQLYGANGPLANVNNALGDFGINAYETGVEGGYTVGPMSLRLSWLYGMKQDGSSQNITYNGRGFHDVALQGDYFFGNLGTTVSAFYYNGRRQLNAVGIEDNFQRAALFGTYTRYAGTVTRGIPTWQFEVNGAMLYGTDDVAAGKNVSDYGTLIEGDVYYRHKTALALRYDTVRSAGITGTPVTGAYTLSLTNRPGQNLLIELEYRKQINPRTDAITGMIQFLY